MKVTTKVEEYRVPIFQVNFISSSKLHWLAVEALLISHAKKIDFYRLYMGMIFGRLISYNKDHAEQFSREELDQAAKVSVKFGDYAISARYAKAELSMLMDRDFLPLGSVSNLIFRGRSKSEAFSETAKLYSDISRAQPTGSPVKKTKITSHHEERTLQRRWAKYTTIIPYIHCYFVKRSYELEGDRELDHSVLMSIVPQYLAELTSTKRTKPIRLSHVRQLIFLPSKYFSEFVPP